MHSTLEKRRVYRRALYARNPEKVLARNKRWHDANPEKVREGYNRWLANNRERVNAYHLARYYENKERHKSYVSPEVRVRNRERLKAWVATLTPEQNRELKRASYAKYIAKFRDVVNAKRRARYDPREARISRQKSLANPVNHERAKIRTRNHKAIRRARERAATIGDLTDIAKIYQRCADLRQGFRGLVVDHIVPLARGGTHEASNLQIIYDFENWKKNANASYKPRVIFR